MKKSYLLVFLTAIISGFAIFINQFGVKTLNPYVFTWFKSLSVAFLLTGLLLGMKEAKALKNLTKKQWFLLVSIGLIGGSIPFLLFFKGLSLTTAIRGAFLHITMFLYVAVLAAIFLKEKINKSFFLGGLLLILGNLILLKKFPYSINQGDLFIFLATLFWAVENTISKYVLRELSGRVVAWGRMFFGSLFIFIFLLFTGRLSLLPSLTFTQINWIIITSIILFGYLITWYNGLKNIPVFKATVILLFGFPVTTLLSLIWAKEITLQEIFAGLLIILGIILVLGLRKVWYSMKEIKKLILVYVRD